MNTKQLNKKLLLYMGIGIGLVALIAILSLIVSLIKGGKQNYKEVENKMVTAATKYYSKNPNLLPQNNGGMVTIDVNELVNNGELKSLSKLLKNEENCSGEVIVTKTDKYYYYAPTLNCGKNYKTVTLADKITEEKNIVTEGDGLYLMNNNYVFRGEKINNYVKFNNKNWRILRVDEDGTIRLLIIDRVDSKTWDDRYNIEKESAVGINDFRVSRIYDSLKTLYNDNIVIDEENRSRIVPQDLCIGKRSQYEVLNDGSLECSDIIENEPFGLILVHEYMNASLDTTCESTLDPQCRNYNYLGHLARSTWTLTADVDTTHKAFKLNGRPSLSTASSTSGMSIVVELNSGIRFTKGDGSKTNPYIVS